MIESRSVQVVRELELKRIKDLMPTRDNPGEGFASVLMMMESLSAPAGVDGRRMCRDHIPRPPPMACNFRFERVGMSLWSIVSSD